MVSNINIQEIKEILSPEFLLEQYKPNDDDKQFIEESRKTIENILLNKDKRLLVIVGPCSIHDYTSALDYARMLEEEVLVNKNLFIVMRVYFEKPRSRTGWKGFIYDPNLDDSFDINKGLTLARKLLLELTKKRIPIGCEFLDTITPQYLSDLVSWGAIGARTSESQIHRQLASGLSMPIGFKNLTSGDYEKAIDGIISASYSHNFIGVDTLGKVSQVITKGNKFGHLILRGGIEPNYYQCCIEEITKALNKEKLSTGILIDCSHGNSQKECSRQILVALYVKRLRLLNKYPIRGIMLESNIHSGSQKISKNIKYGVSVTDACIDIESTKELLSLLNTNYIADDIITNLSQIRGVIREFDIAIHENKNIINKISLTKYIFEADSEINKICNDEKMLMNISMRLALSEKVAELKYKANPFKYLLKSNDFLSVITDREVEKDNVNTFNNNIYLKIMEISKNLQVDFLEAYTKHIKIGYLFGKGSFSHEAVQNFRGTHIVYDSIDKLETALFNKEVDFILVPTYNSIIGEIILSSNTYSKKGSIEHKIELNVYCNKDCKNIDILFLEPHIQKEAKQYIKTLQCKDIRLVRSTSEGCKKILEFDESLISATIASAKNECNLFYTIDRDIVKHNITTFSLFMES